MSQVNSNIQEKHFGTKERMLLNRLVKISAKGNHAEVKYNHDGSWTVYEVKKKKEVV